MSTFPGTLQSSLFKEQQGAIAIRNEKMISQPLKTTLSLFSLQATYSCLPTLKIFLQHCLWGTEEGPNSLPHV